MRRLFPIVAALLAAPLMAVAGPHHPPSPPGGAMADRDAMPPMSKEMREKMMKKMHTMMVLRLGELLDYDTARTVQLSEQLQPFAARQKSLQMENHDAMQALHQAADGKGGDVAALSKLLLDNRVKMVELHREMIATLTKGASSEKAAKVALFIARFPRHMERMAEHARGMRGGMRHGAMGGGCPRCQGGMGPGRPGGPAGMGEDIDDD